MQDKKFFKVIIFIVVLCIPIIYSFFYLKSYWDPYGSLNDIKIAIVNLDQDFDGKNEGNELVKKLKEKDVMNFCEVSQEEATNGLQDNSYYATLTIPSNFTKCLNSAKEENKMVATITYSPNQQSNYLASQIINKVVTAAEMELQSTVSKEVVSTLADNLSAVPDSLQEISNGADKIYNGTVSLNDGLTTLSSGISVLDEKYIEFNNGIKSAYEGSSSLNSGIASVNAGIDSLNKGASNLDSSIAAINAGVEGLAQNGGKKIETLSNSIENLASVSEKSNYMVNTYSTKVGEYASNANEYVSKVNEVQNTQENVLKAIISYSNKINQTEIVDQDLKNLADEASAALNDQNASDLKTYEAKLVRDKSELNVLGENTVKLSTGLNEGTQKFKENTSEITSLMGQITKLNESLSLVKDGTGNLKNGVQNLSYGVYKLQDGASSLENGLKTISESSEVVEESLNKLDDGSKSASLGSQELLSGVDTFKSEIDKGLESSKEEVKKLDGVSEFVADPVTIEEEPYGEVSSYGIAFTPLFLSIGLWVGALMCYVVLYYDQRHRFGKLDNNAKNKILQNLIYVGIGFVDGFVTGLILKLGLGFEVANGFVYYLECAIVGAVFMTIIQFLIRNFGDIGKFLALIVLVLQLAAAGGTFPVETIDKGFRFLNPLLPMTYSIKVFKECLISTNTNFIGKNTLVLIGIALVLGAITLCVELIKKKNLNNNLENTVED